MIVLLAAGVGVCVVGLLAIGFGIPINDTSFGNALLIAGVVILCTGLILIGMWLVARELARLVAAQGAYAVRPVAAPKPASPANPFAAAIGEPVPDGVSDRAAAPASPPPWADEIAARAKPRPSAPEIPPPIEPAEAPRPPAPDRPARRNLLFATKRRDKPEFEPPAVAPPLPTALEAEPKVSFESAWPNPSRPNGSADRSEPPVVPAEATSQEVDAGRPAAPQDAAAAEAAKQAKTDLAPGVTVVRSGTVDEMAYTYYSDGSIEAQLAGESPIRFASLDALRVYVEQRK